VSCSILGCYLVLRRMSLLGDAISHAVLPGLVLAFLLTGSIHGWAMVAGAAILGILTAALTQGVHRLADVPEDASMGVVFTSLFALGVIMISRAASRVDLDPGCVLYGLIEFTPLDTVSLLGFEVPRAVQTLLPTLVITIGLVTVFWKELKVVSFDPALARAMGFRVSLIHYLLMAMVAGVTVASFEAVGSILVIAMLIVPAATAHLLTDRLGAMMIWATVIAALSGVFGYLGAAAVNTSVAGMMAVAAGGLFTLAVFFAPRHGVLSKMTRRWQLALRIAREDVLGQLYRKEEDRAATGRPPVGGAWIRQIAHWQLRRSQCIVRHGEGWDLTDTGRNQARELVRTHRLWESFMNAALGLPLDHVHDPADRMEHFTDPALRDELAANLENPALDPHGKPIPPSKDDR
jgi:manganese/zinc/iron transport system permease protein